MIVGSAAFHFLIQFSGSRAIWRKPTQQPGSVLTLSGQQPVARPGRRTSQGQGGEVAGSPLRRDVRVWTSLYAGGEAAAGAGQGLGHQRQDRYI